MATKKKLLQAAAGVGGAEALNVEDVFSTHLYTGTDAAQTITNGIDLAGEGGLIWMKNRTTATTGDHALFDSETATVYGTDTFPVVTQAWVTNSAGTLDGYAPGFTFTSTGFTTAGRTDTDQSGVDYATWSFRKCPKFFDVVSYTGNSTSGRTISHNLGAVPAMIIVMGRSTGDYWVYHKDVGNTKYLELNKTTAAQTNSSAWNNTTPTDSVFTVGNEVSVNYNNFPYTAFIFADNDGDGEFGSTADQDIIKCGSYTGTGSDGTKVTLGFEPQWIIVKNTTSGSGDSWWMFDNMRGLTAQGINSTALLANTSGAEITPSGMGDNIIEPLADGFNANGSSSATNFSGNTYIYIAIRRGPMAVPESATDVFAIDTRGSSSGEPGFKSGFVIDTFIDKIADSGASGFSMSSRLTQGKFVQTNSTAAEGTQASYQFDYMNGFGTSTGANADYYAWMWKRAPKFFDVVAYTGTGSTMTINHNLGVTPEMIWTKRRNSIGSWIVYHSATGLNKYLFLNSTAAVGSAGNYYAVSDTTFGAPFVNSGGTFISYLFASLDGVSKVGSYTGNGSSQTIDCGFSSGARFVLIKRTDSTGDWYVWDTERGIVAANDPHLSLNSTAAEVTTDDSIDPVSSGFAVNQVAATNINVSSASYIFYAVS